MALFECLEERARCDVAEIRQLLVERLCADAHRYADMIATDEDEGGD